MLPLRLQSLVSFSASSTVYVGYDAYLKRFRTKIDRWFQNQGFPLQIVHRFWEEFCPAQWCKHNETLATQPWRLTEAQVLEFKKMIHSRFVLHMVDHQSTHLMIFCPLFYFQSVLRTDQTNFILVALSEHQCRLHLVNSISGSIRSRYRWGIQANARLPRGSVFLNRRRTKLPGGTASAIEQMLHLCFPDHFGAPTLPQIFHKIQAFFATVSNDEDIRFINDDLIGFFNSVPQARILECVCILLQRCCQLSTDEFITVCSARRPRAIKSVAGRAKGAGDPKYWKHIQIVQATFSCGIFTACSSQWRQGEGTSIGNQISPISSALHVVATEIGWLTLYQTHRLDPFLPIRYVGNRFIMYSFTKRHLPAMQTLFSTRFYGSPIELEDVGNQEFLGFLVDPSDRTIQIVPVKAQWQVRRPYSAGSPRSLLSSLRSRILLARRYGWPPQSRQHQIQQIKLFHLQLGFGPRLIREL